MRIVPYKGFPDIFSFTGKKILLVTHKGADVDAITTAGTLYFYLKQKNFVEILVPEHINLVARKIAEKTGIPFTYNFPQKSFDVLIATELNSFSMLGEISEMVLKSKAEKFVVDHHEDSGDKIAPQKNTLIDEKAVSCTEVVYNLLKQKKQPVLSVPALFMALGLITDSGNFRYATLSSFKMMLELLKKSSVSFQEMLELLKHEDKGQKIAKLKAVKRSKIFSLNNLVLVTSWIGSFEADSASAFITLGADISFVAMPNKKNGKTHVSGRVSYTANQLGIDVAEIFVELKKIFGGSCGGHARAAAFSCENQNHEKILRQCVLIAQKKVSMLENKQATLNEY